MKVCIRRMLFHILAFVPVPAVQNVQVLEGVKPSDRCRAKTHYFFMVLIVPNAPTWTWCSDFISPICHTFIVYIFNSKIQCLFDTPSNYRWLFVSNKHYLTHLGIIISLIFLIQIDIIPILLFIFAHCNINCAMGRNVIYCERNGTFEFYGSTTALSDVHPAEELGINNKSLNNVFGRLAREGKPLEYISKTGYIIRRGEIQQKVTESKSLNHLGLKKVWYIQVFISYHYFQMHRERRMFYPPFL